MRRVRAIATGRVQGVSYRASAASAARHLGVVGWARNRRDGSVELEAEGPDDRVAAFLAWCADGPPGAAVAHVAVDELAPTGADTGFTIRPTL
ncbi:MAG: acylphosphatase [Deltaproteobacteria bacterium]|nr:acylphosphatase [Deltaproteobacteria bacterium]